MTETQNVSSSGIYCTSPHYLAPLSKVGLTLVLPRIPGTDGNELIKCEGIVVRCEPVARRSEGVWELACMFSDLDGTRREVLEDFVTWRNLQALRAATRAARPAPKRAAARPGKRAKAGSSATRKPARGSSRPAAKKATSAARKAKPRVRVSAGRRATGRRSA